MPGVLRGHSVFVSNGPGVLHKKENMFLLCIRSTCCTTSSTYNYLFSPVAAHDSFRQFCLCNLLLCSKLKSPTSSLIKSLAPPPWHCVPDYVILASRGWQTGHWWHNHSAGGRASSFHGQRNVKTIQHSPNVADNTTQSLSNCGLPVKMSSEFNKAFNIMPQKPH